jgi:transcriptional regulator with XRE-family HTH domain
MIGKKIKETRKSLGISVYKMAKDTGIDKNTITRMEKNDYSKLVTVLKYLNLKL